MGVNRIKHKQCFLIDSHVSMESFHPLLFSDVVKTDSSPFTLHRNWIQKTAVPLTKAGGHLLVFALSQGDNRFKEREFPKMKTEGVYQMRTAEETHKQKKGCSYRRDLIKYTDQTIHFTVEA